MNIMERLQKLEERVGVLTKTSAFRLEHGGVFRAECDPLTYLLQNGVDTPRGEIVGINPPEGHLDPLSAAVYEEINRIIKEGR